MQDERIGDLLGTALSDGKPRVALVGFTSDEGVRRNNGRPGASQAPAAIRQALARLTPDALDPQRFIDLVRHTVDLGDVTVTGDLEADQKALAATVGPLLAQRTIPIILGGGHETTFGHFLAYANSDYRVTLINWDAHTDVREPVDGKGTSGTPFRQALAHPSGSAVRYSVAGLLPHSVAAEHLDFVRARGEAIFARDVMRATIVRLFSEPRTNVLASFDLDAVDRAWAPGVSAPATGGLSVELWLEAAYRAAASPLVTSLDLVELNPLVDRDGQTAALAALTVWWMLKGVCDRSDTAGRPSPPAK